MRVISVIASQQRSNLFMFILLIFSVVTSVCFAEDIAFEATVNANKVALNESVQLTLTVTGAKKNLDPINLPTMDGFTARYIGPQTAISITNGSYHSERSFNYQLLPNQTGRFQIPVITTTIDGQSYSSKPIDLEVVDVQANSVAVSAQSAAEPTQSLQDKVKLAISVSKQTAFVGEPLIVNLKLYVSGVPLRNVGYPQLDATQLEMGQVTYQQSQETVEGINYDVVNFKLPVYPKVEGDISIGPAQLGAQVLYQQSGNNDDFFQGFLRSYSARPINVTSGKLVLHVEPLPESQKPQDFSGAVGQFDFQAYVSPTEVQIGDPITLKMALMGDGLLKGIPWPAVTAEGFKKYDPKETITANGKSLEQVIIPNSDQLTQVPAVSFTYFDSLAKEYRTITRGPFNIKVLPANKGEEFKAVGYNDLSKNVDLAKPISVGVNPIVSVVERIITEFKLLIKNVWFWVGFCGLILATVGWLLWQQYQHRLMNDIAFSRKLNAHQRAGVHLKQVKEALSKHDVKGFYDAIDRTLVHVVADLSNVPTSSLVHAQISEFLLKHRFSEQDISSVKLLLHACESVRFAAGQVSQEEMKKHEELLIAILAILKK